ncbi:MAG: cytochrome c oxidase assembly protein [Propionibacteriales bacterium]|nr:cytochrome c oxidase assembly protein [Propionibacteriales bacterium]
MVLASAGEAASVPAIDLNRVLTAWSFEPLPIIAIACLAVLYGVGVWKLRRQGDQWPVGRTVSFLGGLGALLVATTSSLATYDDVLLSMHMVQHMVLSMLVPIFLALGAPVTLALRTLPAVPRRWLLSLLHSRLAAVLGALPVAFTLFILSPWVLYFSSWYGATLRSPLLHELLHLHVVVVGCLFFWPLLGLDPVPGRVAYPFRMLAVFATLPFHAFLGVTIMSMPTLIVSDWYDGLHRSWPPSPFSDQHIAGGILWGLGDLLGLIVFSVLFVQWVRESTREAAREDRRLDRDERARRAGRPPAPTAPVHSDRLDSR